MGAVVFGLDHFKSIQGVLKIVEVVVQAIGFLLIVIDSWTDDLFNAYIVGTVVGAVVSLLLLLLYVSKIAKPVQGILAFQLYFHLIWFIYLLVVSAIVLSKNYPDQFMAGGAFGLIAAFLYLVDAVDCYRNDPTPIFCLKSR